MARHLLPVAAYTGAATMTPCRHSPLWPLKLMCLAGCTALPLFKMAGGLQCSIINQALQGMDVSGYSQWSWVAAA